MAMNTAARPIMLCMKATSSGILVISTRWPLMAPARRRPPARQHIAQAARASRPADDQRRGGQHRDRHADHAEHCRGSRWSGGSGPSGPGCETNHQMPPDGAAHDEVHAHLRRLPGGGGPSSLLLEHLQHPARDQEAAETFTAASATASTPMVLPSVVSVSAAASIAPTMTMAGSHWSPPSAAYAAPA